MSFTDNALGVSTGAHPSTSANAFEAQSTSPAALTSEQTYASPAWDEVRARVAAMSPDQRLLAARQAEILTVAGQGLAARPYAERRAILSHMAPNLARLGVGDDQVGSFDPNDRNLAQAVGEAVILRSMLGAPTSQPPPHGSAAQPE